MYACIHPGINNEYIFRAETAEEAEQKMLEHLESRHGGLASGMLANCRVVEVLPREAFENLGESQGRFWNSTLQELNQSESCKSWEWYEKRDPEYVYDFHFVDEVGNPVLVGDWADDDDED